MIHTASPPNAPDSSEGWQRRFGRLFCFPSSPTEQLQDDELGEDIGDRAAEHDEA